MRIARNRKLKCAPQIDSLEMSGTDVPKILRSSGLAADPLEDVPTALRVHRIPAAAHALRHTAATQMVCGGASFKEVADVLGHASLATTAIYAKLDLATLAQVGRAEATWRGSA